MIPLERGTQSRRIHRDRRYVGAVRSRGRGKGEGLLNEYSFSWGRRTGSGADGGEGGTTMCMT